MTTPIHQVRSSETTVQEADPKPRPRFFYGWVIVAVLAVNTALSMGMGNVNFGLFVKPMEGDLGITRANFGWAQTARQIASGLSSPFIGRLLDRAGARVLLAVSALVVGIGLIAVSRISKDWQLVLVFGLMGVFGLGAQNLMNSVPVAQWFVRRRGRAMAMMTLGSPAGVLIFAPLTHLFITSFGWRTAWVLLGGIGIVVSIPASLLFVRRQPSDMGLEPDGISAAPNDPRQASDTNLTSARSEEISWSRSQALRSPTFWKLVVVFGFYTLGQSSLGLHRLVVFVDRGVDASLVSLALAIEAVVALFSTLAFGFLFERYPARFVGGAAILMMTVSAVLYITGEGTAGMFAAFIAFGLAIGGNLLLQNYIWPDYFGRQNVGSIRGIMMPVILLFASIGPPAAGYVFDLTGSYDRVWWVGVVLLVVAAGILLVSPRPQLVPIQSNAQEG